MATLVQIAEEYGVSRSTARRWVMECMPEVFTGKKLDLSVAQMHQLAHYIKENDKTSTVHEADNLDTMGVNDSDNEELRSELVELKIETVRLSGIIEALNTELRVREQEHRRLVEQLEKRAESAEKALAKEQDSHLGFWQRLGQKLLGSPKSEQNPTV